MVKAKDKLRRVIAAQVLMAAFFFTGIAHADYPAADLDAFSDAQRIKYHLYTRIVFPGIFAQSRIFYDRVTKAVDCQQSLSDMAITMVTSTLSLKSVLGPGMSDFDLLTLTLGTELEFISVISGSEIGGIVGDTFVTGLSMALGDPDAFASYCATKLVSAAFDVYGAFQLWQLSEKITLVAALHDLMWSYYAFGGDLNQIMEYHRIPAGNDGAGSDFDRIVHYFSAQAKVDENELRNAANGVIRYVDGRYDGYLRRGELTPSKPDRFEVPNGVNPAGVVFSWSESHCEDCGPISYNLEVHKGSETIFKADDHDGHLIGGTSYKLPITLLPSTTYSWAVFPKNQYGIWNFNTGAWSGFTTGTSSSNHPPCAFFSLFPATGDTATTFQVNAGGSTDPDGDNLQYSWNWGDGSGNSTWSPAASASHRFQTPGTYPLILTASDGKTYGYYTRSLKVMPLSAPPRKAESLAPPKGASQIPVTQPLEWRNGGGATGYEVFFGKTQDLSGSKRSSQTAESFDPGALEYATTYYWRIDAVNAFGKTLGEPWYFTTEPPPPWLSYTYWDFDTDGSEGWTARNADSEGIYNNDYWIIDPTPDSASKSGIISASNLTGVHTADYDKLEVRAAVKSAYVEALEAHLFMDGQWQPPISLSYVSGEKAANSQCVYRGVVPYSGRIQQVRIDVVAGSNAVDDRVYFDYVSFIRRESAEGLTLSGYIRDAHGVGIPAVTLDFCGGSSQALTNAAGYYRMGVPSGASGTVTPARPLYVFSPSSTVYTVLTASKSQDYEGTPPANTTSASFYSGGDTVNDGFIFNHGFESYAAIQSAGSANEVSTPSRTTMLTVGQDKAISGKYYVYRASLPFDTRALPDDCTITRAELILYGYDADYSTTDFDIQIVSGNPAASSALAGSDFDKFGTLSGGSLNSSGWQGHNGVNRIPLNPTGLAWIQKGGITQLGLRSSRDIDQSPPEGHEFLNFWSSQSESVYRPFLLIEYQDNTLPIDKPEGIKGRVIDHSTGLPVAGATVSTGGVSAQSGADGAYSISLTPGTYAVSCTASGYQAVLLSGIGVLADQFTALDIELSVSLSGVVTDYASGSPLFNATVKITGNHSAQTDPQGHFRFALLPPGVYDVTVSKTGYQTLTAKDVAVFEDDPPVLDIRLTLPGPLTIVTTALSSMETGAAYNPAIRISGGNYPYTYSISKGVLPDGLTLDPVYGTISGTPTHAGGFTFSVRVNDNLGAYAEKEFTLAVTQPLAIMTAGTMPKATYGEDYQQAVLAVGGAEPYRFSYTGDMPIDLYLTDSGTIRNRVTKRIDFDSGVLHQRWATSGASIQDKALYFSGNRSSSTATLTLDCIAGPLSFDFDIHLWLGFEFSGSFNFYIDGVKEKTWGASNDGHHSVGVSAGRHVFKWEFESDTSYANQFAVIDNVSCPVDLLGNHTFTIQVTDGGGLTAEKQFQLEVNPPLVITTDQLDDGIAGKVYNQTLSASGGDGPYIWAVYDGSLPEGLFLAGTNGTITGTPKAASDTTIVFSVSDADGRVTYKDFLLQVRDPLTLLTASLPAGVTGTPYSRAIRVEGGMAPFTFSYWGWLPDGLSLDAATGIISGTPVTVGYSNIIIIVTDSAYPTPRSESLNIGIEITPPSPIMRAVIPDTGQSTSYTNTFGEDSDYPLNPPSYTKLDVGGNALPDSAIQWAMVKENVTGLIWENKTDDGGVHDKDNLYTWQTAQDDVIAQLNYENFGGHSDWRLPTAKELTTLVHRDRHSPSIQMGYFPKTMPFGYWSSTPGAGDHSDSAWAVNFFNGGVFGRSKSTSLYVRAVCGEPSGGFADSVAFERMADNGDHTVTDTATGLMWQQTEVDPTTWEAALSYCENLTLAGYTDWRLPSVNELQSLVDYAETDPAIDTVVFLGADPSAYWSSTSLDSFPGAAWSVHFDYGLLGYYGKFNSLKVRAVRDEP